MKSLDEQIEYMRDEVGWKSAKVIDHGPMWEETLDMCKAILDTLLQLKEKSNVI